eukprot:gnl/TRDRNA2_/TRDRNA2_119175_c1_seq1.p1 gnl/TRDRNA2_/TRDRNA2_119175_c1~~gnl/TRDRNA2_/TRDRNA2_119175_c1_seq1.p1  ORF type:complete len:166 (+),score=9.38 gnl/TRDRNA2_/TRDRNA2_119175_c1_seq1:35-499(+)
MATAALRLLKPRLVVLEINMSIPPPLRFSRQCHVDWRPNFEKWLRGGRVIASHGCSLSAAVDKFRQMGYSLHSLYSQDAIFVDENYAEFIGGGAIDEIACYRIANMRTTYWVNEDWVAEWATAVPSEALANVWCNFTIHDSLLGISHIPFSLGL